MVKENPRNLLQNNIFHVKINHMMEIKDSYSQRYYKTISEYNSTWVLYSYSTSVPKPENWHNLYIAPFYDKISTHVKVYNLIMIYSTYQIYFFWYYKYYCFLYLGDSHGLSSL